MVSIPVYGDIKPSDDYLHPAGPEPHFNESMYFNFFDNSRRLGGFLRIGNRVNEGYAEVTLCLYLPEGAAGAPGTGVLFNYKRPAITANDSFDAGGMRFEVLEPLRRLRTAYDGHAVFLADPSQMQDPASAFRSNPHLEVSLHLDHEAVGPAYGSAGQTGTDPSDEFARAHYEQHMHVTGTLSIGGQSTRVDAFGLRDHSWGPRYWQAIQSYRWLTCAFDSGLGIMVSEVHQPGRSPRQTGVVIREGRLERITSVALESQFRPGTREHTGMRAALTLESGEVLTLEGGVVGYIPLRNRRQGMTTHIGEGMTEYRLLGRTGLGISEYLDQVQ